jgi:deoxyribose-phosphate aldolase
MKEVTYERLTRDNLTEEKLAKAIDHSLVAPLITHDDVIKGCEIAKKYNVNSVAVKAYDIPLAVKLLKGTDVKVGTVVGFPHGSTTPEVKNFEARQAVKLGAVEIDAVTNFAATKSGDFELLRRDIKAIIDGAGDAIVKIILETCYLTDEEKIKVCKLAEELGAEFVKTSTGFGTLGATAEDVRLMRKTVSPHIRVKAAGGIRDLDKAIEILEAGADRIGATRTAEIIEEWRARQKKL